LQYIAEKLQGDGGTWELPELLEIDISQSQCRFCHLPNNNVDLYILEDGDDFPPGKYCDYCKMRLI